MDPLARIQSIGEDAARVAVGSILSSLATPDARELVEQLTAVVGHLDAHRELAMMCLYGSGQAIQNVFPERELHGPIMDQTVGLFTAALINPPGSVVMAGRTQDILSHEDAMRLERQLGLTSPSETLVPSRFTAWAQAQSRFAAGHLLAHSQKLAEILKIPEHEVGLIDALKVTTLFTDLSLHLREMLLPLREPMLAAVADLQQERAQHGVGRAGCSVLLVCVTLTGLALRWLG